MIFFFSFLVLSVFSASRVLYNVYQPFVNIVYSNMPSDMQQFAVSMSEAAMATKYKDGMNDMAAFIEGSFERMSGFMFTF